MSYKSAEKSIKSTNRERFAAYGGLIGKAAQEAEEPKAEPAAEPSEETAPEQDGETTA